MMGIPLEYNARRHCGEIFTHTALTLMEIPCPNATLPLSTTHVDASRCRSLPPLHTLNVPSSGESPIRAIRLAAGHSVGWRSANAEQKSCGKFPLALKESGD